MFEPLAFSKCLASFQALSLELKARHLLYYLRLRQELDRKRCLLARGSVLPAAFRADYLAWEEVPLTLYQEAPSGFLAIEHACRNDGF